jgi:D-inositol-3-phosphate glycosyltransferase
METGCRSRGEGQQPFLMNDPIGTSATQESRQRSRLDMAVSRGESNVDGPGRTHALSTRAEVALLTGGGDKPYALGMALALSAHGVPIDFVGSDDLDVPELRHIASLNFLNLRGNCRTDVSPLRKVIRILAYYLRLVRYAVTAQPKIFHILWNNKFALFDRTILMLYYRLLGKKIVFTAHNVNAGKRDGNDTIVNRLTLRVQYRLADHIFVHTARMKDELAREFGACPDKVTVIPFGINNTIPDTALHPAQARARLGLAASDKVILFFGCITPYKGLEYLVAAFAAVARDCARYRLIIAGKPKRSDGYWRRVEEAIARSDFRDRIIQRIEYVPDEETEVYFKAADLLALPYTHVFQSGVLFLGYNFGLPVIAADVGSLREEIIEGETGFAFRATNEGDLARVIRLYFSSELYANLECRREKIRNFASDRYSWSRVAAIVTGVYSSLLTDAGNNASAYQ